MTAKAVVAVVVLAVAGRSRQSGLARPAACITGENFGTPPWSRACSGVLTKTSARPPPPVLP